MSSRPLVVVCLAVLVSSLCCSTSAAPRSGAGGTEASSSIRFAAGETALGIPFRLVDDQIVLPVRINDTLTVDMILDTGLGFDGAMLLDMRLGMQLGLTKYAQLVPLGGGGAQTPKIAGMATGTTLGLRGVTLGNRLLLVLQDSTSVTHWHAAGIIGKALMGCVVEIDFQKRVLNVSRSLPNAGAALGHEYPITFEQGIPVVSATVVTDRGTEVPVRLLVDTGSNLVLLLRPASRPDLRVPKRLVRPSGGVLGEGMNGPMRGSVGRVGQLRLGSLVLDDVQWAREEGDGLAIAAALEAGLVGPGTVLEIPERIEILDTVFQDFTEHPAQLTVTEIVAHSSNLGTILLGEMLGAQRLHDFMIGFGQGRITGVDFPGEAPGVVRPVEDWCLTTCVAGTSIGYHVSVTALQMAMAYSAIANDGVWVRPHFVAEIVDGQGSRLAMEPERVQVVSAVTARQMREMLAAVVENITVPVKGAAPLGLILTELITNAGKYAFTGGRRGTIRGALKKEAAGARLEVRDDGVGLPARFDLSRGEGMGLNLVKALAAQINGRFRMESGAAGTRAIVEFAAADPIGG